MDKKSAAGNHDRESCLCSWVVIGKDSKKDESRMKGCRKNRYQSVFGCGPGRIPAMSGSSPVGCCPPRDFSSLRSSRTAAFFFFFSCRASSFWRFMNVSRPIGSPFKLYVAYRASAGSLSPSSRCSSSWTRSRISAAFSNSRLAAACFISFLSC